MLRERVIRDNADGVYQRRNLYRVLGVVLETVITDGEVRHIVIGNDFEAREIFDRRKSIRNEDTVVDNGTTDPTVIADTHSVAII